MLHGQMLPGQMSPWQLKSVQDCPRNLHLKFGQNRVSNSWDVDVVEFAVVVDQSHFRVKPNLGYVRLSWGWVGVLTLLTGFDTFGIGQPITKCLQIITVLYFFASGEPDQIRPSVILQMTMSQPKLPWGMGCLSSC